MIRQIVVPTQNNYTLELPDEMVGKKVEVIVFEIENVTTENNGTNNTENRLRSIKKIFQDNLIDMSNYKFNRDEANNYYE
ncbi:MAG: hypothetical protein LC122_15305 [Chitinophagales bacterium]|nr:hypothetical protein [Chitinophagales bacterium]